MVPRWATPGCLIARSHRNRGFARSPSGVRLPAFDLQAGDSGELAHIAGHQHIRIGDGNAGDHEIGSADGPSFPAKLRPHDRVVESRLAVDWQRLKCAAEYLYPLQVFGEPGGILCREMQLRSDDAAKARGAAGV